MLNSLTFFFILVPFCFIIKGTHEIQLTFIISTSLISNNCLSRSENLLEVKIWSLLKHENLTIGNKILWKRGEIAPKEQFLLFSTIFSIYL